MPNKCLWSFLRPDQPCWCAGEIQLWPLRDGDITQGLLVPSLCSHMQKPLSVHTCRKQLCSSIGEVTEPGHEDTRAVTVTSQKTFQVDDLEDISLTSLSGLVLNMGCNISYSFGLDPMAPNDGKTTLSLGVQLSLHCITLPCRNVPHVSSVGFADFQIAACGVSHASGCWIKDPFYIRVFHSISPLITY